MSKIPFNENDVRRYFRLLQLGDPEVVLELRAFEFGKYGRGVLSGYFDREDPFVAAARYAAENSPGCYVTVNPNVHQLLARRVNRAVENPKNTTTDAEIARRCWIPIDLDPVRPAGVSSSDPQKEAALAKGRQIHKWLKENGFPEPVVCDSGNGVHLLVRDDRPNTEDARESVSRFLELLAKEFNDEVITVDVSVCNAARILRVAGTMNRKGDHHPRYPHRLSRLLTIPESLKEIAETKLENTGAPL